MIPQSGELVEQEFQSEGIEIFWTFILFGVLCMLL